MANNNKIILNGKTYGVTQIYEVAPPTQHFHIKGQLIKGSNNDNVAAIGCADIILNNGMAIINFAVEFTTGGSFDNFNWGISPELICNLNNNIPYITPINGGFWDFYDYNSSKIQIAPSLANPRTSNSNYDNYWTFGRYYESTLFELGWWGSINFNSGTHIHGTCYGTYDMGELERGRIINGDIISY